ncbi:NAD-P-binding protein [Auriscalpium vulgare]|uniref:NAD-P-binding protein n=1 Tax=Auriscalpium vulgare TaxID=40419 RepID=A0ACB8RWB5_9AGAM|nr:NAD-P-binding protein [Auriscalpium vulgare]
MSSGSTDDRKSVLITGCSAGGIGHALATEFHAKGLRVFATSRTLMSMQDLADMGIETLALDVTDANAIQDVRNRVSVLTGGKLHVLVNNAGQGSPSAITDVSLPAARALFEVNFFAPIAVTQAFVPLLIAANGARVVQIGSIAAVLPLPFGAVYSSSKAALHVLNDVMRVELAPFGIKVINICSGSVQTNISRAPGLPADSLYKPMEDLYIERRMNVTQKNAAPLPEYARRVVAETLRANPTAWLWIGQHVWLAWFLDTFLWRTAKSWFVSWRFGLNVLAQRLAAGRR